MLPLRRRGARPHRADNVATGRAAERRARRYYRLRGYRILDTNARAGRNEIDLVVRRGSTLVFCEVKMRSRRDFGDAVETVNAEKRRRLRCAAELWLVAHPKLSRLQVSFEVLGIGSGRTVRIRDAF